ncbi:MAG: 4-carboxymuconolactone decarboxylase [Alphaproteobacteria bacterium]|nr:4-carboxymuconolactone decarboxylase [Alphaproteobacteria bacterium]
MSDERRERGLATLRELMGPEAAPPLDDPLVAMAVDHVFADVWSRPGLELRERSLVTCAALVALGKEHELRFHLRGLLNTGVTPQAVEEMMIHLAHYAGWPAGVNGLRAARQVIAAQS